MVPGYASGQGRDPEPPDRENELIAMLVCRTYVKAQREYTLKDWDGDGIFAYAQKLRSDPGKKTASSGGPRRAKK